MGSKLLEFESGKEKYLFFGIIGILLILVGTTFFPLVKGHMGNTITGDSTVDNKVELNLGSSKTPDDYYQMFQCSCCGQSIAADCCGMAKQRKDHVDKLLMQDLDEDEIVYQMVKKFGFDVLMDQSKEQEVRDYIRSKAPDNPSKIEIKNPKYDFGTVSQSEGVVSTTFTIENTGGSDLIIENMDTSCMCTTASLIYQGKESPKFGMSMHGENPENFELVIPPGESALLKVYFDPNAHGKQKKPEVKITREVSIISNDPVDFQKKVKIELTQVL